MRAFLSIGWMVLFLIGCSVANTPKDVATKFFEHLNKGEIEEAKKYCDGPTADLLGAVNSLVGSIVKEKTIQKNNKNVEVIRVEEKGNKAKVYFKGENGKEESINLKKVNGKWKVYMNKEDEKKEDVPSMKDEESSATE